MIDPDAVNDNNGEYIEIFNATGVDIDLNGYTIGDAASSDLINESVIVPAGGFIVMCRNLSSSSNGGIATCAFRTNGFNQLNNSGAESVILLDPSGGVADRVDFNSSTWPIVAGAAMTFTGLISDDNNVAENWIAATVREPAYPAGAGDFGSPGTQGVEQNVQPTDALVCESVAPGLWTAAATWDCGVVPGEDDAARVQHAVLGAVGEIQYLGIETGGSVVVGTLGETDTLYVEKNLSLTGSATVSDDAVLFFRSDAAQTATISHFGGSILGTGKIIAERWFTETAGWRMIAAPFNGVSYDRLNGDFHTQGASWANTSNGDPILWRFDEDGSEGAAFGAQAYFAPNTNEDFVAGEGYFFYAYDTANGQTYLPDQWDVPGDPLLGPEPTSPVTRPLYFDDITEPDSNFTLLGNPFLVNLDFDEISDNAGTTGAERSFWVWDPATSGYVSYSSASGVPGSDARLLPPFQGFWMQSNAAAAAVEMGTDDEDNGPVPFYVSRSRSRAVAAHVGLRLEGAGLVSPGAYLVFQAEASEGRDAADVDRLQPFASDYALVSLLGAEGRALAHEARPDADTQVFEVSAQATEPGTYTLSWPTFYDIPETWALTLTDLETGAMVDLREQDSYTFQVAEVAPRIEPAALLSGGPAFRGGAAARFEIAVETGRTTAGESDTLPGSFALSAAYPNPFNPATTLRFDVPAAAEVRIEVFDTLGRRVALLAESRFEAGSHSVRWNAEAAASGLYLVRMQTEGFRAVQRVTLLK